MPLLRPNRHVRLAGEELPASASAPSYLQTAVAVIGVLHIPEQGQIVPRGERISFAHLANLGGIAPVDGAPTRCCGSCTVATMALRRQNSACTCGWFDPVHR